MWFHVYCQMKKTSQDVACLCCHCCVYEVHSLEMYTVWKQVVPIAKSFLLLCGVCMYVCCLAKDKNLIVHSCRKLQQEADREISAPSTGETHRPSPPPAQRCPEAEERAAGNEGSLAQEVSSLHQCTTLVHQLKSQNAWICSTCKPCVAYNNNIRLLWKSLWKMTHFNFKSHCILCLLALLYWQQNEMKPCSSLIGILIVCASLCVLF